MKKYVKLLLGCLLAFGISVFTACENLPFGNNTSDSVSVESSSSEEVTSSSEESSSEESSVEESSSDETSVEESSSDETSDSTSDAECIHSFTYETLTEASCENTGVDFATCSKCEYSMSVTTPALGHTYKNGICIRCENVWIADSDDLATSEYISTSIITDWNMHSDLTVQSATVSTDSTYALRGAFNVANADEWYDSSQDPNGDGGPWVWTVITLDLVQLYGETTDLSKATLTFDMKVTNGDVTSSIILLNADDTKSAQLPFNQSAGTPFASPHAGYSKTVLSDGWVRMTADFCTLYGEDASAVDTICIIVSNANGDYINDTVYYLDNMSLTLNDIDDPQWPILEPKEPSNYIDMDSLDILSSYSPEGYGVTATLSETQLNYNDCIKGTFNNLGADTYPGEDGGDWVWTFLSIDIPSMNSGYSADLRNRGLKFKLQLNNCSPISSIILYDENGTPSEEIAFRNDGTESYAKFQVKENYSGWYIFTINLPLIYDAETLENVTAIDLVFSNAYSDGEYDSSFYIADLNFVYPTKTWTEPTVYNHEGYYDKSEALSVMFAGNSFIEFSASAYWLNEIAQANGANLTASYTWTPNGRIPDQYENAFGTNGYMTRVNKPNVIFIQDFYTLDDALDLGAFLTQSYLANPYTEVIVYTADNESEDGILAANHYGLDLVNWRGAIHALKNEHGFSQLSLNYPDGALHANELNGVFGAAMAYMQLYGEIPDADALFETVLNTQGREGDEVQSFLPGITEEEKKISLSIGLRVCATLCGLDPDGICLHEYNYATDTEPSCETEGLEIGTCIHCGDEVTNSLDPIGHSYTYATTVEPDCETEGVELGTCQICGGETTRPIPALTHIYKNGTCLGCGQALNADPDDLATSEYISTSIITDWNMHSDLTVQSKTVSTDSTYALRGAFNVANADEWYDSPEDGGTWVWTVITLDLVQLYGGTTDLSKATLTFDMKVTNGDVTSSIILLKSDGTKSAQLPFNQSAETPFASPHAGYSKMILSDGWVRMTADFRTLYGADASAINTICIIVSNAFGDYVNDTVYYLDNMELYIPPIFPQSPFPFTRDDFPQVTLNQRDEAWFAFTNLEYTNATYVFAVQPSDYQGLTVEVYNPVTGAKIDVEGNDYDYQFTAQLALGEAVYIRLISNSDNNQCGIFVPICNA